MKLEWGSQLATAAGDVILANKTQIYQRYRKTNCLNIKCESATATFHFKYTI